MAFKSLLSPESSVLAGVATAAFTWGIYEVNLGTVAGVHKTSGGADVTILQTSLRKAGFTALAAVAGIALLARDPNIAIIGGASVIALELHYRHAIQMDPDTGQPIPAGPAAYGPVEGVSTAAPYGGNPYGTAADQG